MSGTRALHDSITGLFRDHWAWVALGVATLLALADFGNSWFHAMSHERNYPAIANITELWIIYAMWVGIAVLIRRFGRRYSLQARRPVSGWLIHAFASLAVGMSHLGIVTVLDWVLRTGMRPGYDWGRIYTELLAGYLAYELLLYWFVLLAFSFLDSRRSADKNRSPVQSGGRLAIRVDGELNLLPLREIEWIQADGNRSLVWWRGRKILTRRSLRDLEAALDSRSFVRAHRSALINLRHVRRLTSTDTGAGQLILDSGATVPISRRRKPVLRALLEDALV